MVERENLLADFYADESDSDESDCGPLRQALPVVGNLSNVNESVPPENGEEYIKHVILEARRQPRVKKACDQILSQANSRVLEEGSKLVNHNITMPHINDPRLIAGLVGEANDASASLVNEFVPDCEWKASCLLEFDSMRRQLEEQRENLVNGDLQLPAVRFPQLNCKEKWFRFCFGDSISPNSYDGVDEQSSTVVAVDGDVNDGLPIDSTQNREAQAEMEAETGGTDPVSRASDTEVPAALPSGPASSDTQTPLVGTQPMLSVVVQLKQAAVDQLLEFIIESLKECRRCVRSISSCIHTTSTVGGKEADGGLNKSVGLWLYALLSAVETPLTPSSCAIIRDLARVCRSRRARIVQHFRSVSSAACKFADIEPQIRSLNLLICLIAEYFRQRDLADPDPSFEHS